MSTEGFPPAEQQLDSSFEARLEEHGGIEDLQTRYGLGREEFSEVVTFGSHTGTVLDMVMDEACPVGGKIEEAYAEGGIEEVQKKLNSLNDFAPEFKLTVSGETLAQDQLKKN